jgi:hypothetical protein
MTHRTTITLLLTAVLQSAPLALPAQSAPESAEADANRAALESTAEAERRIPFDPVLVGLPDLPDPLARPEDFARAQGLIEARLAELVGPRAEGQPAETGGPQLDVPADDATEGQAHKPRIRGLPLCRLCCWR